MAVLFFLLAVFGGLFFYWLRCKHKILYGLSEVAVGIAILALRLFVLQPRFPISEEKDSTLFNAMTLTIALFIGIYVMVRGLDNIAMGWKERG